MTSNNWIARIRSLVLDFMRHSAITRRAGAAGITLPRPATGTKVVVLNGSPLMPLKTAPFTPWQKSPEAYMI